MKAEEDVKDVYKFLTANETRSHTEMTHQVLEFYKDWWVSQSGMLAIAEDSRVEELNRCISRMFELGVPLALGEKRTPQFTLFQEIEIRGNKTECITAEETRWGGKPLPGSSSKEPGGAVPSADPGPLRAGRLRR
ncbi:unnamed protein product [Effrenium voratum]|nr:unnamed protein product [Effrenium voratum]